MIKITGLTSSYLTVLADDTHALNGLVKILSALDPVFKGKNFEYTPQDEELFLSLVPLSTILYVNSQDWISEVKGYPWFVAVTDTSVQLPEYWKASVKYDEEGENPTQMTMAEWAAKRYFTLKEYDDGGTTKYLIGNLTSIMDLSTASLLQSEGWELKSISEAQAIYSGGVE